MTEMKSEKAKFNVWKIVAKYIHEMSSAIIWGSDVNEKVGKFDYIDMDTKEIK